MAVSRAIGVLGGSFNPPHLGHLAIASDACSQLDLEQVVFVPAAAPPHKDIADDVPAGVRLEMTHLAVAADERFGVSSVEIDLGLRFTSDTLAELQHRHGGAPLVFIAGSDAASALRREPSSSRSDCSVRRRAKKLFHSEAASISLMAACSSSAGWPASIQAPCSRPAL